MRFGHLLDGLFTVSLLGARLDLERVELVGEGRGVGLAYGWCGAAAKVDARPEPIAEFNSLLN